MQRSALKSIGKSIAASAEEATLEDLKRTGKSKFRVVNGKKVVQIIEAIVDDVIEREAGDIAKRDRDSIVKQTQRKFERVMRLQSEQDARLAQLQDQLSASDEERRALKSDKCFLEEQLEAARKSAPEGEAVRLLTRELGRVKAGLEALDRKTKTLDGSSIERIVNRLGDREAQLTEHFHDELDEMRARLDKMTDESARIRDAAVEAVFERLVEKRAAWDDSLVSRIETRIDEMGERLGDLAEQAAKREGADKSALDDHMREIDERFAAVERASAKVKEEAVATLIDRMADRDAGIEQVFVAKIVAQLEGLATQVETLEGQIAASRTAGNDELVAQMAERIDAIETTLSKETGALRAALEEMTESAQERDNFVQSLVSSQLEESHGQLLNELNERFEKRDAELSGKIGEHFADVRSSVDDLAGRTAAQLAAMQVSLTSGVDSLREEGGSGVNVDLVDALESRVFKPMNEQLSVMREQIESRHEQALSAVAAADTRGNDLAERLEQIAESVVGLARRVDENAEAQTRALEALGQRLSASAEDKAGEQQAQFNAALETALDKITRTMQSATAKPIEISAEATDVLLNKIFDGDSELTSNLDRLEVDTRNTGGTSISKNLGKLRGLRNAKSKSGAKSNGKDD